MTVAETTGLYSVRCKECNATVQTIRMDDDGRSVLYPCGHSAAIIAALVNKGDRIP